jgi:hypothetical protein
VNRRARVFFAVVAAPLIALALAAAILVLAASGGRHVMWQATDRNLVAAIHKQNPVAVKVLAEALPSIDSPIPFSHPGILGARQIEIAPLAIALLQGHRYMVDVLREAGSDPAKALGQLPADTAAALLRYARETQNALAIEYLTEYPAASASAAPAGR